MLPNIMRRSARRFMIAVAVAGVSACSDPLDSSAKPSPAPAYMRLAIGPAQPVQAPATVMILGNQEAGAMYVVAQGTSAVHVRADWLDAARNILPDPTTGDLELSVSGATFTKGTGTRSGVISGLTPGSNIVEISAFSPGNGQRVFVVVLNIFVEVDCSSCGAWDY